MVHIIPFDWSPRDVLSEGLWQKLSPEKKDEKTKASVYQWCCNPTTEMVENEYVPVQLIAERLRNEGYESRPDVFRNDEKCTLKDEHIKSA
jgi:hypothetical protein